MNYDTLEIMDNDSLKVDNSKTLIIMDFSNDEEKYKYLKNAILNENFEFTSNDIANIILSIKSDKEKIRTMLTRK